MDSSQNLLDYFTLMLLLSYAIGKGCSAMRWLVTFLLFSSFLLFFLERSHSHFVNLPSISTPLFIPLLTLLVMTLMTCGFCSVDCVHMLVAYFVLRCLGF